DRRLPAERAGDPGLVPGAPGNDEGAVRRGLDLGAALDRRQRAALCEPQHLVARRHRAGLPGVAERKVLENGATAVRRPLPDVVPAAVPDPPVERRRPASGGAAAQDERLVDEHAVEPQLIDVRRGALLEDLTVGERNEPAAELRRSFRIETTEKMPSAVDLVVGHQRRAV